MDKVKDKTTVNQDNMEGDVTINSDNDQLSSPRVELDDVEMTEVIELEVIESEATEVSRVAKRNEPDCIYDIMNEMIDRVASSQSDGARSGPRGQFQVDDSDPVPASTLNINNNNNEEPPRQKRKSRDVEKKGNDKDEVFKVGEETFIKVKMSGDGNCFFRSIAYALETNGIAAKKHSSVRAEICDHIACNWKRFGDICKKQHDLTTKVDYLAKMRADGEYADHSEVLAAAELYQHPIRVLSVNANIIMKFPEECSSDKAPLLLVFDHAKEHYDALERVN